MRGGMMKPIEKILIGVLFIAVFGLAIAGILRGSQIATLETRIASMETAKPATQRAKNVVYGVPNRNNIYSPHEYSVQTVFDVLLGHLDLKLKPKKTTTTPARLEKRKGK